MALSTVSAVAAPRRAWQAQPTRPARAAEPLRARAARRALAPRCQEAGANPQPRPPGHRHRRSQKKIGPKRLGAAGWEFVHVCVDDATRLAYAEVVRDERGQSAAGFLRRAVAWFRSMGIQPERVLSDNGACYRSTAHAAACRELGLRHSFTRPYRPSTNGKAERFIKTLTQRWAYGAIYANSSDRTHALPAGSTTTTSPDHTAPSATSHPQLASTS